MASGNRSRFVVQRQFHQLDEEYATKTWQTLHNAIHEIHRQNASGLSFEELYRNAYNMVLHKFGDKLYAGLEETITTHLRGVAAEVHGTAEDGFLQELKDKWDKHKISSIMIRDILMYMDRTYVVTQKKTPVYDRGLQIFRDEVCRNPKIKDRLLNMMLDMIKRERQGEMIPRSLLKTISGMFVELGREVYRSDFENPFLQESRTFYQAESQEYMAQNSASDYMKKAEARLLEEAERVSHYLDSNTEPRIREVAERELIAEHMQSLAHMENSGIKTMIEDSKVADLARAYQLFKRVTQPTSGLGVIRQLMAEHCKARGTELVNDEERNRDPVAYVQGLLQLRDKYQKVIDGAFQSDKQFYNALNNVRGHPAQHGFPPRPILPPAIALPPRADIQHPPHGQRSVFPHSCARIPPILRQHLLTPAAALARRSSRLSM